MDYLRNMAGKLRWEQDLLGLGGWHVGKRWGTTSANFRITSQRHSSERRFLQDCTDATISTYTQAFRHFHGCATQSQYEARIIELREGGVSAVSCNVHIRCLSAYLRWSGTTWKLQRLRQPNKVL
jgi:hypothetical protein